MNSHYLCIGDFCFANHWIWTFGMQNKKLYNSLKLLFISKYIYKIANKFFTPVDEKKFKKDFTST